jgi:hypothetical protein
MWIVFLKNKARLCFFLTMGLLIALSSAVPSSAQIIHENPMALVPSNPQNVGDASQTLLQAIIQNFGQLSTALKDGNFTEAQIAQARLDQSSLQYETLIRQFNLTGADYASIAGALNYTNGELAQLIDSSELYNSSILAYNSSIAGGQGANASKYGIQVSTSYNNISSIYSQISKNATVLENAFAGMGVDTSSLTGSIEALEAQAENISSEYHATGFDTGSSTLVMSTDQNTAPVGGIVNLTAILRDKTGTPIPGAKVTVYLDGHVASSFVTNSYGEGSAAYVIPSNVSGNNVTTMVEYLPSGTVSNSVLLNISSVATQLSLIMGSNDLTYTGRPYVTGILSSIGGGMPASGKTINFSIDGNPIGDVITDEYGMFTYPFNITPDMPAGLNTLNATFVPADGDVFQGSSGGTSFNVTAINTTLTLNSDSGTYALGDIARVNGSLFTSDGSPVQGVNVTVALGNATSENFTTDNNGIFDGMVNIPDDVATGNYSLYAIYGPSPGSSLNAASAGPININLFDSGLKVALHGMSPVLFPGEGLNVTGTLTTGNDMPLAGKRLNVSLNGASVALVTTNGQGNFNIPGVLTGNASPGFYSLVISNANTSAVIYSENALLLPIDPNMAAGIIVILLALLTIGTAQIFTGRRKPEIPSAPAPAPVIASPPDHPAPPFNLDSELTAVRVPARQGDLRAAFTGIYIVAKKIISHHGIEVKDSMTHLEFYWHATEQLPVITTPLGCIVGEYEKAIYSGQTVTMAEFDTAIGDTQEMADSLREKDSQ